MIEFERENYSLFKDNMLAIRNWCIEEHSNVMWNKMSDVCRISKRDTRRIKIVFVASQRKLVVELRFQKTINGKRTHIKT